MRESMSLQQIESTQMAEIGEIKDWNFDEFFKYSILQALRSASEDVRKYAISVGNIEALMCDELEKNETYKKSIDDYQRKLDKEFGDLEENAMAKVGLMANFKFIELIKLFKSKIPKEIVGEV